MARYEDLPYRPCVGVMLLNRKGLVFVGRRKEGREHIDATHVWQMPQGGLDPGEEPYEGALRELYEETNVRSVERLAEAPDWLAYDIPRAIGEQVWKGKYRGRSKGGSRCASPETRARSTSSTRPAASTNPSSSNGDGSR